MSNGGKRHETHLSDQVVDMPHIFIILRTERDVPLMDQLPDRGLETMHLPIHLC